MPVPVAGRRKGQTTAPTTFVTPTISATDTAGQGVPPWLDDAPASASPPPAVVALADPEPSSFSSSPSTASAPFLSPNAFSAAPASSTPDSTSADLPAFLRDVEPQPQMAARVSPASQLPRATQVPPSATEAERQQIPALREELSAITQQLADATKRVEELQGESNSAAAAEVRELEITLSSLREKEAEAQRQKEERAARAQRVAQAEAASAEVHADLTAAVSAYRAERKQHYQSELDAINLELQVQWDKNAALQKEYEEAMSTTPESRCQTVAFDALQRRLQDGVRHLKRHFSQHCSSTVALAARTFLAAARQQRNEVLANDAGRRTAQLQRHRAQREISAAEFHEECHGAFQRRADSLFGALKVSLEKRRRQVEYERNQRLSAFHAQLRAMTEHGHVALEQQLRASMERELAITAAQRDSAKAELALRRDELVQQRLAFQTHAESEYQSLRETHRGGAGAKGGAVQAASLPKASAISLESLRRDMDGVRAKLSQIAVTLRTKQQSLQSAASPGQSRVLGHSLGQMTQLTGVLSSSGRQQLSYEGAESQWRGSLLSLQQHRELLRKTIADLKTSTNSWSGVLQRGRSQLTEQREGVRIVRRDWEGKVRAQLSSCLTLQNPQVPTIASLAMSTLEDLNRRVGGLMRKQRALRSTRSAFAGELATWVESFSRYRSDTERLLGDVFSNFESLCKAGVQTAVDELALRSTRAQVEILHGHISQEASRLAAQKRSLGALMNEMRGGKPPALPSSITSPGKLSLGQSTQIFKASTSPLIDITNESHHFLNCDPPQDQTHAPEKAETSPAAPKEAAAVHHTHPSSATTRSLTVAEGGGGNGDRTTTATTSSNDNKLRLSHASDPAAPTTVSAGSGADWFSSDSPSPITPSFEGHHGWMQHQQLVRVGGGRGFAGGAYISVSPQTKGMQKTVAELAQRRPADSKEDSTMDLEPLDADDEDESDTAPLRPYRSH
ncbi:hypothetical protein ABL78_0301 [Leptomonas seymouri]|uniref:L6202.3-like protein n=1 Tax=Leptomonas seymouri TaxID=5684 RepID=A0A0N1PFI1_LEPSE|nr:hypothetical protein ABL78_0301 [Leptomonas seymouri]|eukprot:KPI90541.1 hypothetical protein ABL78_0301 [Leptomonas seymouri]